MSEAFRRDARVTPEVQAERSRQPAVCSRTSTASGRRTGSRQCPVRERVAQSDDGWAGRRTVSTPEHLGTGGLHRQQYPVLPPGSRVSALSSQPVRVPQTDGPATVYVEFRRPEP